MNGIYFNRRRDENGDPVPRWTPDSRNPWKPGERKGAWIWPRDKDMSGSPVSSWQRWKDVFTGKGPAIFKVSDRTSFEPTRPVWSNWTQWDNLGYPDPRTNRLRERDWQGKRYDFKSRKYTTDWRNPEVWSDVKWGRDPDNPLYVRDSSRFEHTRGFWGPFFGVGINDFRYNPMTPYWDWMRPWPEWYWRPHLRE